MMYEKVTRIPTIMATLIPPSIRISSAAGRVHPQPVIAIPTIIAVIAIDTATSNILFIAFTFLINTLHLVTLIPGR